MNKDFFGFLGKVAFGVTILFALMLAVRPAMEKRSKRQAHIAQSGRD